MINGSLKNVDDVVKLFPVSPDDVKKRVELAIERANADLSIIENIKASERTFENTARAYDDAEHKFNIALGGLSAAKLVSPDKDLRDACHEALLKVSGFVVERFLTVELYKSFKEYDEGNAKKEDLNSEQRYFVDESMNGFRYAGLHLPSAELAEVKCLQKELADLSLQFDRNIADDKRELRLSEDQLLGVDPHMVKSFERDKEGKYIVPISAPVALEILKHCDVSDTRREAYRGFRNRGYPKNKVVLEKIIAKRDELAKHLGFSSYAHYDLDSQMIKTPEKATKFIRDLLAKVANKEQAEFELLTSDLPEGVVLEDGKFKPWDARYAQKYYENKYFKLDDREIAKYFPMEKTINGIFDIYQQFLNLYFKLHKPKNLWHEDAAVIEIHKKGSDSPEGYIFLDLYPRDDKYPHACHSTMISPIKVRQGKNKIPSAAIVVANFPKSTAERPSLLMHSDVETFFHEFGHAMHGVLGRTEMSGLAGTSTKRDFVEVASQMFEEWMWQKEILKRKSVCAHYETGQPLPDELIDKMIELKNFVQGFFIQRQCFFSLLSLAYFAEGANKDVDKINRDLYEEITKHVSFDPLTYGYASFGHLTVYAAKYYGYLWAKVLALDSFVSKCKKGLLDGKVGQEVINKFLGLGGSVEPDVLMRELLGREPSQEAFLRDIGVV